jgi:hypothetical protein
LRRLRGRGVIGGGRPDLHGAFVEPTILTDVTGRELARPGMPEFVNRRLICAVAPDAPIRGFAG